SCDWVNLPAWTPLGSRRAGRSASEVVLRGFCSDGSSEVDSRALGLRRLPATAHEREDNNAGHEQEAGRPDEADAVAVHPGFELGRRAAVRVAGQVVADRGD